MRSFDIPEYYRSSVIATIKRARAMQDQRKRDLSPSELQVGGVRFKIARHFGFCFGVENAIEIAYRALREHPDKRVFLLSEMIHNPHVNEDLRSRGVRFLRSTDGAEIVPFDELSADDIVIVPAFGTTVELFHELAARGVDPYAYNATCPFVEKVWKRSRQLGERGYSVVIHGKHYHEETRATFSHATTSAASVVVRDLADAERLAGFIRGEVPPAAFYEQFQGKYSANFEPQRDLVRIGVVNQTTMLATETQAIASYLREVMHATYPDDPLEEHFADTRDTLCYATSENQDAVKALVESGGDCAIVIGGYNSSNTSHLVKLCSVSLPTFFIKDAEEILDAGSIRHLDPARNQIVVSEDWFPVKRGLTTSVLITAGASCPDVLVDQVISRITKFFGVDDQLESALEPYRAVIAEAGHDPLALAQS